MDDGNRDGNIIRALAGWAFRHDIDEIFAVVRPGNTRAAATDRRNGMEWVGETGNILRAVAAGVPTPAATSPRRRDDPAAEPTPE